MAHYTSKTNIIYKSRVCTEGIREREMKKVEKERENIMMYSVYHKEDSSSVVTQDESVHVVCCFKHIAEQIITVATRTSCLRCNLGFEEIKNKRKEDTNK